MHRTTSPERPGPARARLLLNVLSCSLAFAVSTAHCETATFGGVEYTRQPWGIERPAPTPSAEDQERGWIAFVPSITDGIGPDYRPVRAEIGAAMRVFSAPGEFEPATFAIYALRDTGPLDITSGPLISTHGKTLREYRVDVRAVTVWPQRTSWRSSSYYIIPELLESAHRLPIPAGKVQQFWVSVYVPPGTQPDLYQGYVRVAEGLRTAVIPISLRVVPFVLKEPKDRFWGLWPDTARWRGRSDNRILDEMVDWRTNGVTRCILYPLTHGTFAWEDGRVKADLAEFERHVDLYLDATLSEPIVISLQGVAGLVRRLRGLQADDYGSQFAETLLQIAGAVEDLRVRKAWPRFVYHTVDEPGGHPAVRQEALETLRILHDAGYRTFTTADIDFTNDALDPYLDVRCYGVGFCAGKPEQAQARKDECEAAGDDYWWYGIGCYTGQEGSVAVNRHLGGFLFHNTGAQACWAWTFQRPNGDPFNDFDGTGAEQKDACITYPGRDGASADIPTLQWEGTREGVDDVRYLDLLSRALSELDASESPGAAAVARATRAELSRILKDVPWLEDGQLPSDSAQVLRWRICELLFDCAQALGGALARPSSPAGVRQGKPVFESGALPDTRPQFEPAVPAARAPLVSAPPVLDGDLSDWDPVRQVALLTNEHGQPAPRTTRVFAVRDRTRLYVAFRCDEDQMDLVRAEVTEDDGPVWSDDSVEVFLGAAPDPRSYCHFVANSRGTRYDARVRVQDASGNQAPAGSGIRSDATWNADWTAKAAPCPGGWCVEMAVPLAALGWDGSRSLYANFTRTRRVPGGSEYACWSPTFGGYHRPARFGRLLMHTGALSLESVQCSPARWGTNRIALDISNPDGLAEVDLTVTIPGALPERTRTVLLPGADQLIVPFELDARGLSTVAIQLQPASVWAKPSDAPQGPLDERARLRLARDLSRSRIRPTRGPALSVVSARWLDQPLKVTPQRTMLLAGQPGVDVTATINLDTGLLRRSALDVTFIGPDCNERATLEPGPTGRTYLHLGTASLKPGRYEFGARLKAEGKQLDQARVPLWINASPWN